MIYIGLPISYEECLRLLKLPDEPHAIDIYLAAKDSSLVLEGLDKGVCAFGIKLDLTDLRHPLTSLEEVLKQIVGGQRSFYKEILRLKIDLSFVNLSYMEEGEEEVENPSPVFIAW